MRIVSLLPAATEICFAIGMGDAAVGVSPECDYPPPAQGLPRGSRALLPHDGKPSAEVSRQVGARLDRGESLYAIEEGLLRALAPDLILTQRLCEVCAPSVDDVREVARRLPSRPQIVSLDPHGLDDILEDIRRVAHATGMEDAAKAIVEDLRERIDAVETRSRRAHVRPRVACLEWLDPLFAAGHWVPELVGLAGGEDILGRPREKSRRIDAKDIAVAAPEVAVLIPCGFHMDRVREEASILTKAGWWQDLPAPRRDRVWLVDGSSYFNRPGPRVVDGLEILAHILHPDLFPKAWPSTAVQKWGV